MKTAVDDLNEDLRDDLRGLELALESNDLRIKRLRNELEGIGTRLESVDAAVLALNDNRFDANAYRKSLHVLVKEDVYTKLRNFFGFVSLIASVGGAVVATSFISRQVEEQITSRSAELGGLTNRIARDSLIWNLQRAQTAGWPSDAVAEIKRDSSLRKAAQRVVTTEKRVENQQLVFAYAARSGDSELRKKLIELLTSPGTEPSVSAAIASELLHSPSAPSSDELIHLATFAQDRLGDGPVAGAIAGLLAQQRREEEVEEFFIECLKVDDPTLIHPSMVFFAFNPTQDLKHQASIDRAVEQWSGWKRLIYLGREEKLESRHQEIARSGLDDLRRFYEPELEKAGLLVPIRRNLAERFAREGMSEFVFDLVERKEIKEHEWRRTYARLFPGTTLEAIASSPWFAYRWESGARSYQKRNRKELEVDAISALRKGVTDRFQWSLGQGSYDMARWAEVASLFPDSKAEGGTEHDQQRVLAAVEQGDVEWDRKEEKYRDLVRRSVESLQQGDLGFFLTKMEAEDYYPEKDWVDEVLPLFPEFAGGNPTATGRSEDQKDLLQWVRQNQPRLIDGKYRMRST
jgi:hypothetical protein